MKSLVRAYQNSQISGIPQDLVMIIMTTFWGMPDICEFSYALTRPFMRIGWKVVFIPTLSRLFRATVK